MNSERVVTVGGNRCDVQCAGTSQERISELVMFECALPACRPAQKIDDHTLGSGQFHNLLGIPSVTVMERWSSNICQLLGQTYWVNLSKTGGKDGVFRGLAGLLRGIPRGRSPREILRSSPASPRKTPSIPILLL